MKRFSYISVFVVLLFGMVLGQTSEPTAWTSWYEYLQFYKTGATTLTNKTLTSPTIDGIATMDSVAVDSLNISGQLVMATTAPIYLRDATEQIYSSVNGQLDIDATTEVEIATTTLDLNGALDVSGAITAGSTVGVATSLNPDAADGAAIGTTSLEWSDSYFADGAVIYFGADQDVSLTHVADTGLLLNAAMELEFRDATETINSSIDGQLDIDATTEVEIATTTLDLNGALDVSGTSTFAGNATTTGTMDATITDITAGSETGHYVYVNHTTEALTGELIGIRGNVRNNFASAAGTFRGGQFQSGNMDAGFDTGTATGVYAEVVNKIPTAASATWTNARGYEISMDLDQGSSGHTNTVTNSYMFYGVYNLPTAGTYATVTNGYGIFVRNEAVGGTGQMLDAAFYADDKSMSGGIKGWDYGLDFSGIMANFGTADI